MNKNVVGEQCTILIALKELFSENKVEISQVSLFFKSVRLNRESCQPLESGACKLVSFSQRTVKIYCHKHFLRKLQTNALKIADHLFSARCLLTPVEYVITGNLHFIEIMKPTMKQRN